MASLKKKTIVSYQDRAGSRVPKGTPGAKKVKEKSSKWYGQFKNPETGKWECVPLSTDKEASRTQLAEIVKAVERGQAGLIDPHGTTKTQSLDTLKQAYLDDLRQQGRDGQYLYQTDRLLKKVFHDCQVATLGQLTADKLDTYLQSMTCSARTKNTYRQACFGLMNFLVRKKKLAVNPLRQVSRAVGDEKRKRRALPLDQLQRLLDAARTRPLDEARIIRKGVRKGQSGAQVKPAVQARLERIGRQRALLYLTALHTGLRRGELASLRVNDLNLDAPSPFLELDGSRTKNKQTALQPIRADLAAELKSWIADTGKHSTDKVFVVPSSTMVSKFFKKDLKKAGIPYQDDKGRFFDFHALRKCTGTYLRRAKVDPAISKLYLRHSDIRLTMEVYNDESLADLTEAMEAMPRLTLRQAE